MCNFEHPRRFLLAYTYWLPDLPEGASPLRGPSNPEGALCTAWSAREAKGHDSQEENAEGRTLMDSVSVHTKSSRLLIADDHAVFAEALRVYLEKTHTVVGLVRDGHAMVG